MKSHLVISAPTPLVLLGDLACDFDRNCLVTAIEPRIAVEVSLLKPNRATIALPSYSLHIELSQLTPVFDKTLPAAVKQLVRLVHTIWTEHEWPFGFMVKTDSQVTKNILPSLLVSLLQGLAVLSKQASGPDVFITWAESVCLRSKIRIPAYRLAGSLCGNTFYYHARTKQVELLPVTHLTLLQVAVTPPTLPIAAVKITDHIAAKSGRYKGNLDAIERLALTGVGFWKQMDIANLGHVFNRAQHALTDLGLISQSAHRLCVTAMLSGAFGAKLSPDFQSVLIVCDRDGIAVRSNLIKQGIKCDEITIGAEGIKIN